VLLLQLQMLHVLQQPLCLQRSSSDAAGIRV
jgi:hypothetical protein